MKVLITGATGLIGSHLIDYLLENTSDEIYAIKRARTQAYLPEKVKYFDCDITDFLGIYNVLLEVKPEIIYHLSAQSYQKISVSNPLYTLDVNVNGTVNLLEAILKLDYIPQKIIIACSGAGYGEVKEYPTTEDTPFNPLSLYGVTKATQDLLGYQYYKNFNLPIVRTRSYIHVGSRQGENTAISAFAKQVALIEKGLQECLWVGNLDTQRDILDVRDAVRAFYLLSKEGKNGEAYNICSGKARKMADILDTLLSLSTDKKIVVRVDKDRLRPSDIPLELGSYQKLFEDTGWYPQILFDNTLRHILDYWREKIG